MNSDKKVKYPFPEKPSGGYKSKEQERSSKENRAIWILKGRDYTHAFQGVLPASYIKALMGMQKDCIQYIKAMQKIRMQKAKRGKKK